MFFKICFLFLVSNIPVLTCFSTIIENDLDDAKHLTAEKCKSPEYFIQKLQNLVETIAAKILQFCLLSTTDKGNLTKVV